MAFVFSILFTAEKSLHKPFKFTLIAMLPLVNLTGASGISSANFFKLAEVASVKNILGLLKLRILACALIGLPSSVPLNLLICSTAAFKLVDFPLVNSTFNSTCSIFCFFIFSLAMVTLPFFIPALILILGTFFGPIEPLISASK